MSCNEKSACVINKAVDESFIFKSLAEEAYVIAAFKVILLKESVKSSSPYAVEVGKSFLSLAVLAVDNILLKRINNKVLDMTENLVKHFLDFRFVNLFCRINVGSQGHNKFIADTLYRNPAGIVRAIARGIGARGRKIACRHCNSGSHNAKHHHYNE